jgi:hypothetical protein
LRDAGRPGDEAEDFVHVSDNSLAFFIGEFAFWIAHGLEGGLGLEAGIAILLKLQGLTAGAGESVDEASEGSGVAAEFVIEGTSAEIAQGIEDVKGAELQGALVDLGGVAILDEVSGGFLTDAPFSQPVLMQEPILVAPLFPFRKMFGFEVAGWIAQALDNFGIWKTVEHHLIQLVPHGFGQASNETVATVHIFEFRI